MARCDAPSLVEANRAIESKQPFDIFPNGMSGEKQMDRRQVLAAGTAAVAMAGRAAAQDGSIRIIYPFAAGGAGDAVCRILAEKIRAATGRNTIVENRTGASGLVAIKSVMNAPPDGTNILVTTGPTMYLLPLVEETPSFDALRNFRPVSVLGKFEFAISTGPATNAQSLQELFNWFKANPTKASFGVPSFGTIPHFAGVQLSNLAGVKMDPVPYRGGVPLMNDLVGGHVPMAVTALGDVVALKDSSKLKVVAVASETRSPFIKDVPTLKELGINLVADSTYGMWLPANTPDSIANPIIKAVIDALKDPDVRERINRVGTIADGGGPEAVIADVKRNQDYWKPVVAATGYKLKP
jgi:tripartite-type tricarboxylate transporter receptor subunit TctC